MVVGNSRPYSQNNELPVQRVKEALEQIGITKNQVGAHMKFAFIKVN